MKEVQALLLTTESFERTAPSLHDAICIDWRFEPAHKRLRLQLCGGEAEILCFEGTIAHEMTSYDFWGPSLHIQGWKLLEGSARRLFPRIHAEMVQNNCDTSEWDRNPPFEVQITFISGDHLTVLCRSISAGHCFPTCKRDFG